MKLDSKEGKSKGDFFSEDIYNQIKLLQKKNNWYNFFSIALDYGLIALAIALSKYMDNIVVYLLSIVLIGGRITGINNLMHEASHALLFKSKWLNKWITSFLIAYPLFTIINVYREHHFKHHKYLWTDKDPDTVMLKSIGLGRTNISKGKFILRYIFGSFLIFHLPKVLWGILTKLFSFQQQSVVEYLTKILFWLVILTASIYLNFWTDLLLYWFVPLVFIFPVIRFWSDIADHGGLETDNLLYSSRNSYGTFLERLILYPHHDTFHLIHHLFPAIPHYNLKKAHLILLQNEEYAKAHHCRGFFKSFVVGFQSVIDDIISALNQKI